MQRSDMQVISVLAEEKNMRKAAERLFVSQPALSQRLHSIEEDWGISLFVRSKKGLLLTSEGEKVADYANQMLEVEGHLRQEMQTDVKEVNGTLKIAVASIIGQYWLPKMLKKYVARYPQVKISLMTGWSSEILRNMYEDESHIGIIRGNPKWRGIKCHLFSDTLHLVDTQIQSLKELPNATRPYIQFRSDSNYHHVIQDWWHQSFKKRPERTIIVDQIETCKQMALNGIGYAILPEISLTERDLEIYRTPLVDPAGGSLERETLLLTSDEAMLLRQVKAFVDLVNEELALFE